MSTDRDEWSVGALDLDAYLARVGYTGPLDPSGATLDALYRAHLGAIRFENLDIFIDGGVRPDLESIQDKLVNRRRGGYCYEQAQLFGAVAARLGFDVQRLLARVGPDGGRARPRTHLTLRVRAGQQAWLADPGFGSSPPGPLSLRRYRSGGPQEIDGWVYEVVPDEPAEPADGALARPDFAPAGQPVWKLRAYTGGKWATLHRWDDSTVYPADVVMSNHYTSTHPDSWFTWQPVIVRRDPDAIRSILGRTYTVSTPGQDKVRRELTDREFADALTGEFGLALSADEVAAAVDAPASRGRRAPAGVTQGS
jgi:N-hydroxyarylamine O-acetyltransferase